MDYFLIIFIFWSFIEAIFFPIPVDLGIIILVKEKGYNPYLIAFLATFFNTLGSIFGYKLGEKLGSKLKEKLFKKLKERYGLDLVDIKPKESILNYFYFLSTVSPLPQKIFAIISGYFKTNIKLFVFYTVIGRGLRYFVVALLAQQLSWTLIIILSFVVTLLYFLFDRFFLKYLLVKLK